LTESIYERLRQEILSCSLAPGAEVYEGVLADRYGVSKTPVREALNALRQENLVSVLPRRGYQIAPITLTDLSDLFDLRVLLEGGAAEIAAGRITPGELDGLSRLAQIVYNRTERPSTRLFVQANREFHTQLAAAARNPRIQRAVEQCLDELERVFYLGANVRNISGEVQHDHLAVISALRDRDGARAKFVMVEQIEHTRQHIIGTLFASNDQGMAEHLLLSAG
jgi:DNA-binding GntR family transcriptional regulator